MSDQTPAEELRAAVAFLRCNHLNRIEPPEGSPLDPGPCIRCGAPFNPDQPNPALAHPLADWLEVEAELWPLAPAHTSTERIARRRRAALAAARVLTPGDPE